MSMNDAIPSIWARIFGHYGRNMDGNTLLFWGNRIYERNAFTKRWKLIAGRGT